MVVFSPFQLSLHGLVFSLVFFSFKEPLTQSNSARMGTTQPPREGFCVCSASKADEKQGKHGARKYIVSHARNKSETYSCRSCYAWSSIMASTALSKRCSPPCP